MKGYRFKSMKNKLNRKIVSISLLILLMAALGWAGDEKVFSPSKDGFISDWLLVYPFANEEPSRKCSGFDKDFFADMGGEANMIPYPKMSHKAFFDFDIYKDIGLNEPEPLDIMWMPYSFTSRRMNICFFGRHSISYRLSCRYICSLLY